MVLTTWAVFSQLYFLAALSVLGNLALLLTTRKRTVTTLSASKSELIVQIGVDGANTREKKVDTLNIESLGYQISTKYGPSGLFVDEGFLKPTCLLLGLTRQQADTIADTICTKFSNIKR